MRGQYVKRGCSVDAADDPVENAQLRGRPSGLVQGGAHDRPSRSGTLIVIERRDFVRGCVACWLGDSCAEFVTVAISNIDASPQTPSLGQAAAALIGVKSVQNDCDWVADQIAILRAERAELPIILIVEPSDTGRSDALARQLNIHGYIPTSSTGLVAAAALRLIVAGGVYFPATRDASPQKTSVEATTSSVVNDGIGAARLTPREEAVLSALASGAQNKIIAYQLSMSLSTVKAHVHSIIQKLKVRNRTEVVVSVRSMLLREQGNGLGIVTSNFAMHDADTTGIRYDQERLRH